MRQGRRRSRRPGRAGRRRAGRRARRPFGSCAGSDRTWGWPLGGARPWTRPVPVPTRVRHPRLPIRRPRRLMELMRPSRHSDSSPTRGSVTYGCGSVPDFDRLPLLRCGCGHRGGGGDPTGGRGGVRTPAAARRPTCRCGHGHR